MTLKEAYAQATPGPLRVLEESGDKHGIYRATCCRWIMDSPSRKAMFIAEAWRCNSDPDVHTEVRVNAALLAHAFNVLPEVVAALEDYLRHPSTDGHPDRQRKREALRAVLGKANNVTL